MTGQQWNPWKAGVIAAAVIVTTAVVTGLVLGSWSGQAASRPAAAAPRTTVSPLAGTPAAEHAGRLPHPAGKQED